jgi:hypothetical protein
LSIATWEHRLIVRRSVLCPFLVLSLCAAAAPATAAGDSEAARITSVTFTGRSKAPMVVIVGTGFGARPAFNPSYAPQTHQNCPKQNPALDGHDYGMSLGFQDMGASAGTTKVWAAGRYTGAAELDCVGLIIKSWSNTKVVLRFGRQYDQPATSAAPSTYVLSSRDPFVVRVKSATFRGSARLSG